MPPRSITESFDRSLPTGARGEDEGYPLAHVSGPSTENADPPLFAFEVSYDIWNRYANDVLGVVNLTQHRLASWEDTRLLLAEADVSDAAAAQLINPVDLALSIRHPGRITSLNQYQVGSARADKCWYRPTSTGVNYFAVLDYKRPAVIRDWEIEDAFVLRGDRFDQEVAIARDEGSLFEENSLILVKQAVNYASQYNTDYVALFDWNSLLLFVMGDPAALTVVSVFQAFQQSHPIRVKSLHKELYLVQGPDNIREVFKSSWTSTSIFMHQEVFTRDNFHPSAVGASGDDPLWEGRFFRDRQRVFAEMDDMNADAIASEDSGAIWASTPQLRHGHPRSLPRRRFLAKVRREVARCTSEFRSGIGFDINPLIENPLLLSIFAEFGVEVLRGFGFGTLRVVGKVPVSIRRRSEKQSD
ncbi:Uncharacterized protein TPAR_01936 [Tolypocladium paradoxum]|uniref:Uncharacterized protein n=1 Tax=Tolypocladium paradoxum TaxID=94208 RepID=A0A2S4L621_9HYPO|nr:Uncharacterized protein TPAR_01936 [Tolypocladium paradoxum]